ncbi:hypothetical protein [Flammeovirga aprica]|uniref:Uncharacterized protein n=1 Tax=Flammeovirga aprica JL-4 TaxID=694437 RepID=A0A7X9S150_9BACT|nr:hypothetical protein [Flammeovirga aprica]NME72443.1 hypothetical protein [Flammeovirga aprica JL-4]
MKDVPFFLIDNSAIKTKMRNLILSSLMICFFSCSSILNEQITAENLYDNTEKAVKAINKGYDTQALVTLCTPLSDKGITYRELFAYVDSISIYRATKNDLSNEIVNHKMAKRKIESEIQKHEKLVPITKNYNTDEVKLSLRAKGYDRTSYYLSIILNKKIKEIPSKSIQVTVAYQQAYNNKSMKETFTVPNTTGTKYTEMSVNRLKDASVKSVSYTIYKPKSEVPETLFSELEEIALKLQNSEGENELNKARYDVFSKNNKVAYYTNILYRNI